MKESMQDMMELIVDEIDGIKREMYLELGGNQKIIFAEINRINNKVQTIDEIQSKYSEKENNYEK